MSEEKITVTDKVAVDTTKAKVVPPSETPAKPTKNIVEIELNDSTHIEMIALGSGQRNVIIAKDKRVKLLNSNIYRIPIVNKTLNIDNHHMIKQYAKFAEQFQVLNVANGIVSLLPLFTCEVVDRDIVGELI